MGTVRPLLVQDGTRDPAYAEMPAVRAGLTRYLGVPIFTPTGEPTGTLCLLDDASDQLLGETDVQFFSLLAMRVSAELERERAVHERVAEHRRMAERLAAANDGLRTAAEEKRRFMAAVIHDLRQPLATMRTTLYLLRDAEDPMERDEGMDVLEGRVVALNGMIEELLQCGEQEVNAR